MTGQEASFKKTLNTLDRDVLACIEDEEREKARLAAAALAKEKKRQREEHALEKARAAGALAATEADDEDTPAAEVLPRGGRQGGPRRRSIVLALVLVYGIWYRAYII